MINVERNYVFPEKRKEGLIQGSNPYDSSTYIVDQVIFEDDVDYKYHDKIHNGVFVSSVLPRKDYKIRALREADNVIGVVIDDHARVTNTGNAGVFGSLTTPQDSLFTYKETDVISIMRAGTINVICAGPWNVGDNVGIRVDKVTHHIDKEGNPYSTYFPVGSVTSFGKETEITHTAKIKFLQVELMGDIDVEGLIEKKLPILSYHGIDFHVVWSTGKIDEFHIINMESSNLEEPMGAEKIHDLLINIDNFINTTYIKSVQMKGDYSENFDFIDANMIEGYALLPNATFVDSYENQSIDQLDRIFIEPYTNAVRKFRIATIYFDCRNITKLIR